MSQYSKITFLFTNGTFVKARAPLGSNLMNIAKDNKIQEIEGLCGGSKACATCHLILPHNIYVKLEAQKETKKTEEEDNMLDIAFQVEETSRLSCQILMTQYMRDIKIKVP